MSNNLYIPFHPGDYLTDTGHLSAAEHGAYFLLILNYWQRGEPLPNDDRKLRGIARMTVNEWMESRETILEFFDEQGGYLHHGRVDAELEKALGRSEAAREAGKRSAAKRAFNGRSTGVQRALNKGSTNQVQDQVKEEAVASSYPAKPERAKRRTAISEDSEPSDRDRQEGLSVGMTGESVDFQWRKFRDYHRAKGSLMADWSAAWRTWCGNYRAFSEPKVVPFSHGPPRSKPSITDTVLDLLAEERAQ
jgi:uncharacterized protein YdaU (DUF1376 family)